MDLATQRIINNFQEKNQAEYISVFDLKSNETIFSVDGNNNNNITSASDFMENIQRTININPLLPIDIISIDGVKESTIIKFLNDETLLILTYQAAKVSLSEVRTFIAKFSIQYSKNETLSIAS